jgi:hypothetical protein
MSENLLLALVGIVGGIIGAAFSSWLGERSSVAQELRELRMQTYAALWRRTSVISTWPTTDATYHDVTRLHEDLRSWYYLIGGISLSENARARYGELQSLINAVIVHGPEEDSRQLDPEDYEVLMASGSALRTALTEDLESRGQRSLIRAVRRAFLHGRQARQASARLRRVTTTGRAERGQVVVHHLTEDEQTTPVSSGVASTRAPKDSSVAD